MSGALIWCPFGDRDTAREVASMLVKERLVACANLIPAVESIFQWEGAIGTAEEVGVLFKTEASLLDEAISRLAYLHPYDTPAIMGWHADAAAPATLAWLAEQVSQGGEP